MPNVLSIRVAEVTPQERFKDLVDAMVAQSEATHSNDASKGARRMFGSTSLKTGGKMFAFLHKKEWLVVKLPGDRVSALVAEGQGERFDPGSGRLQREWFVLDSQSADDWLNLATEAESYIAKRR